MVELLRIYLDEGMNICIYISRWIFLIILVVFIAFIIILLKKRKIFFKSIEIEAAEIGISGQKIRIRPNYKNMQIAYQLWVELNTRKIGLPIDFENDVIVEIYDSWYEFFNVTRELIKTMPISQIHSNKNTKKIIYISTEILNEAIRPHLTKWQAKFRKWYNLESNKKKNAKLSPQAIQNNFGEFNELLNDMKNINKKLIKYKEVLEKMSIGY